MAFPKGTIKLDAARAIFTGCNISEILIGDKVAGYRIEVGADVIEDRSLTSACQKVWNLVSDRAFGIKRGEQ